MGQKLYYTTDAGDISFKTERKVGDVRVPNYVYDLWLPVLGAVAVGVYGMYCRLERERVVKAMTQKRIAKMCRIGTSRLQAINEMLEECGFIRIKKPEGATRLMHWTLEITVLDPPQEVGKEIIEKYAPEDYEILSPWLLESQMGTPEIPNGNADDPEQEHDAIPNGNAIFVSLGLNPLEVETKPPPKDPLEDMFERVTGNKETLKLPKGWTGTTEAEFEICQHVTFLWRGGIMPELSKQIELQKQGAAILLRMFDGDVRETKETISAYHATKDGQELYVAGPQSLANVLPNFIARTKRSKNGVIKVGR